MVDDPLDLDSGLPARVAADAAVFAPTALSVARRLPAWADADGIMQPDHRKLARDLGTDVATIVGALDQLVRRGHLLVEPHRDSERTGYRFTGAPSPPPTRVVPFPRRHNRELVATHAANMARLSRPNAQLYLRRMMSVYAQELRLRGIAEPTIENEVDALSRAIKGAAFVAVLVPDDREPA